MKKWCLAVIILLFAAGITMAAFTRAGYGDFWNSGADQEKYIVEQATGQMSIETLNTYEENMKKAEFIAKVRFTGSRELKHQSMLSTVSVLRVYQGDLSLTGTAVDLYEVNWFSVFGDSRKVYRNLSPVNLMSKDTEYLVFANRKKEDGTDSGRIRFCPCNALGGISLLCLETNNDTLLDEEMIVNGLLHYGDISQNEFTFSDRESLALTVKWKQDILSCYDL